MKVLIADDDVVARHMLETYLLDWNYEVEAASDGDEAWRALQGEDAPRLAILDWMMPGMDGVQICEEVKKLKGEPYIYILMLTVRDRKEDVVRALDAGADDYLTKPYDGQELKARLRTGRRILALQAALLSAREALRAQVTLDPLTGLWNRAASLASLKRELARAGHQNTSLTVFMADLDHFNRINEFHGHLAGDNALRLAAQRIQAVHRPFDTVGRYGGEEFVVILPGYDRSESEKQAERLRASVSDEAVDLSEGLIRLGLSVGAVHVGDVKDVDPSSLLYAADVALARAKNAGGNRVEFASPNEVREISSAEERTKIPRRRPKNGLTFAA
jgi:two-component system cell cycle response regulator